MSKYVKLFENFIAEEQLNLPFKKSELVLKKRKEIPQVDINTIHELLPVAQIHEYLKSISLKKNSLGISKNYNSYLTPEIWKKAYKSYIEDSHIDSSDLHYNFISDYDTDDADIWLVDKLKEEIDEDLDKNTLVDSFEYDNSIEDFLTDEGKLKLKMFEEERFEVLIHENRLFDAFDGLDENGNLDIYRSVVYHGGYEFKGHSNYYEMAQEFKNLGVYWTHESKLAYPHGGHSIQKDSLEVTYHAKVNLSSIDWVLTLVCNAWTSREEKEIRLKVNAPVEIYGIDVEGDGVTTIKPIIVKA